MNIFKYKGDPFINIKGKDYFLIWEYKKGWDNILFIEVFGQTPLQERSSTEFRVGYPDHWH